MSDARVTLTIDGTRVTVPRGTLIVDAAKKAGVEIPVFCYHPKLEPVGMCRMCLVEIGRPKIDRGSGRPVLGGDGQPVIEFGPRLETACTTLVGEGWVVRGLTENVRQGRKEILEFLLTSHPLDCPICDKGGECPLQNLTMAHGPGKSRFLYADKMHLEKRVPLGDLILLDRERCIQCGRCVRFQDEIAGEPVLAFSQRGRGLEIVTHSQPGFDSVFSGNTTDICPVGALTTIDFRFEARPWELQAAASICPHCPVGCNLTLNTRRQPAADGRITVQRVMPRQNEAVNEIWICDKGRFGHEYAASRERLRKPLVRRAGVLVETTWDEAVTAAANGLRKAGDGLIGLAGGRASNEDLFNFRLLVEALGGKAVLDESMAGGDWARAMGIGSQGDLGSLGVGDAILVIASDLQEEAPVWWLRVKRAADRGAALLVANMRPTRLDPHARHRLRYPAGRAGHTALGLLRAIRASGDREDSAVAESTRMAAQTLREANELVIFFGTEGLDHPGSASLAQACAGLLAATQHAGRPGSGLVPVWPRANTQGAWDLGFRPHPGGLSEALAGASAAYILAVDPVGGDPAFGEALRKIGFLVVQEIFFSETARRADVVLPAQAFTEREGTLTSGERRVQRFYPAVPPFGETKPDWQIAAEIGRHVGLDMEARSAAAVCAAIAERVPDYAGVTYAAVAKVEPQWPIIGDGDVYYGGTAYRNAQGLGVKLASSTERGQVMPVGETVPPDPPEAGDVLLIPVTRLYDRGTTVTPSAWLAPHLAAVAVRVSPVDASRLGLVEGGLAEMCWADRAARVAIRVREDVPPGVALLPRSVGVPVDRPVPGTIHPLRE